MHVLLKVETWVFLFAFASLALLPSPSLGQGVIYDNYGVYATTPKNPAYGLGAVLVGYFEKNGKELKIRTGSGLICGAPRPIKPEDLKGCAAPQPNTTSTQHQNQTFDITLVIQQLLNVSGNAKHVKNATVKVTSSCLFELSNVEAQKMLDNDKACLRAAQQERRKLANVSLADKLAQPGNYLLIWQTTRVLHATLEYSISLEQGAGAGVKTEAAKAIKGVSGSIDVKIGESNKVEGKGDAIFVGLAPRYYEQWYKTEDVSVALNKDVERLVKGREEIVLRSAQPRSAPSAAKSDLAKEITSVQKAATETDAMISKALK